MFKRLGEATDVVSKEMYEFTDLGGRHVALRPEQTASVCRAFVQHRPTTPWKTWYAGPNFRYEKPQRGPLPAVRSGRHRGARCRRPVPRRRGHRPRVAVLRGARAAPGDAAAQLARRAGRPRPLRRSRCEAHFTRPPRRAHAPRAARRSSATRCASSTPSVRPDAPLIAAAPQIADFLSKDAAAHFDIVRAGLDALGVPYVVEPRLVRGLDYYLRTTFEFAGGTLESAQNALGGGGRYDGLVEALGGPPTPGRRLRARRRPHAAGVRRRGCVRRRRTPSSTCSSSTPPAGARRWRSPSSCAAPAIAPTAPTTAAA